MMLHTLSLHYFQNAGVSVNGILDLRKIEDVPSNIECITNLKVLKIRSSAWIPQDLTRLTKLTSLDISRTVSNECPYLPHLLKLNMGSNKLNIFPVSILFFKTLTKLDLSHNQIKDLPREICDLTKLEELNLEFNWLHEIPCTIIFLKNLTSVNLKFNFFMMVKDCFILPANCIVNLENNPLPVREKMTAQSFCEDKTFPRPQIIVDLFKVINLEEV